MDENEKLEIKLKVAQHDLKHEAANYRIDAVEKALAAQTEVLNKLERKFTIIGSLLIGAMLVSSDSGGTLLRLLITG